MMIALTTELDMKPIQTKIDEVDRALARWQPRFVRASNEMTRLLTKRRMLQKQQAEFRKATKSEKTK